MPPCSGLRASAEFGRASWLHVCLEGAFGPLHGLTTSFCRRAYVHFCALPALCRSVVASHKKIQKNSQGNDSYITNLRCERNIALNHMIISSSQRMQPHRHHVSRPPNHSHPTHRSKHNTTHHTHQLVPDHYAPHQPTTLHQTKHTTRTPSHSALSSFQVCLNKL